MYKVIKSDFVNISEPRKIEIHKSSDKPCGSSVLNEAPVSGSANSLKDEISGKFYELLKEKEKFSQIIQREKKLIQFEKKKIEEDKKNLESRRNEADQVYESEKAKGYDEGFAKGYSEGKDKYEGLISEALHIKKSVEEHKCMEIESLEKDLIGIVIESIEKIVGVKLEEDDKLILNVLKKGLERLSYAEDIVVRAHGEHMECLMKNKDKMLLYSNGIKGIELRQDDSLGRGDILIETSSGTVDPGVSTQINIIKGKFKELIESGEKGCP